MDSNLNLIEAERSNNLLLNYFDNTKKDFPSEVFSYYRLFRPRLLLQLHKFTISQLFSNSHLAQNEIIELRNQLTELNSETGKQLLAPTKRYEKGDLNRFVLKKVDDQTAYFIHTHHHYLMTERIGLVHLGLFSLNDEIIGLATFSRNDLSHLDNLLPDNIRNDETIVLSRLIIFDGAPTNSSTFFLSKTKQWILNNLPHVKLVLSYMDPNLGFKGSSYLAFNAQILTEETKKRYLYADGKFVTDRAMINRYGTANILKLRRITDGNIIASQMPLLPLKIFCWSINNSTNRPSNYKSGYTPPSKLT